MILDTTLRKIELVLGEAATTAVTASGSFYDSGSTPSGGPVLLSVTTTAAATLVAAPAANFIRQVNELSIVNNDNIAHNLTVRYNDNGTLYTIQKVLLSAGYSLNYNKNGGWQFVPGGSTAFLPLAGGTLTGALNLAADPTTALGAATKQYADTIGNAFIKADISTVVFTKTGAGTVSIKAGTKIGLNGVTYSFTADTAVTMPTLTAGTDYAIYMCNDGSIRADANFTAPAGFTASQCRKIGGFHYAPGGNATAQLGGDTTPAINQYSLWDLKWKPACPDPRGMALIANGFWCDIYICNTAPEANGTSGYNLTIADGSNPPKIPTAFGGDGTTAYVSFNWWEAGEVMSASGKQLLSYLEFAAAAYGTTEAASFGTDPGSTILRNAYTSKWGIMLATGNMLVWGRGLNYYLAGGVLATDEAFSWHNNAGGRGQIYSQGTYGLSAALFGGTWGDNADAGSRTSYWGAYPWSTAYYIGARGRCDHLILP